MTDDSTMTDAPEATTPPPVLAVPSPPDAPETKPAVSAELSAQVRKANKEAESLRLKLKEFEDRDKTEAEKLAARAEAAEKRLATVEAAALRTQVALEKGLPADLAQRLRGDDVESLRADADTLLTLVKPSTAPSIDQGARGTSEPGQWTEADLKGKSPAQIVAAKDSGLLDNLLHPSR